MRSQALRPGSETLSVVEMRFLQHLPPRGLRKCLLPAGPEVERYYMIHTYSSQCFASLWVTTLLHSQVTFQAQPVILDNRLGTAIIAIYETFRIFELGGHWLAFDRAI